MYALAPYGKQTFMFQTKDCFLRCTKGSHNIQCVNQMTSKEYVSYMVVKELHVSVNTHNDRMQHMQRLCISSLCSKIVFRATAAHNETVVYQSKKQPEGVDRCIKDLQTISYW